jgi:hypothetical protein
VFSLFFYSQTHDITLRYDLASLTRLSATLSLQGEGRGEGAVLVLWVYSSSHKYSRKQCKNIRLQKSDKQFQEAKTDGGRDRNGRDQNAVKNENQPQERQDHDMAGDHIGE